MALTEGKRAGEFIQHRGLNSVEEVTVKSGQSLTAGDAIALERSSMTAASAAGGGNTGDGAMGTVTPAVTALIGDYRLVIIEPATDGGTFEVYRPDGVLDGAGAVASAYSGSIGFTLADGATDFAAGDEFTITISEATEQVKEWPNDGTERCHGFIVDDVDASAAAKQGSAVVRNAVLNLGEVTFTSGASDAHVDIAKAQLKEVDIHLK